MTASGGAERHPNLFIIGAPKAGTTTLQYYLRQNSQIHWAAPKEPHFFDYEEEYSKGYGWYQDEYFRSGAGKTWRGEATATYMSRCEKVPSRIKQHVSEPWEIRFIVVLRNPVDRLISHYGHMRRICKESLGIEEALLAEDERLRAQPDAWFGYFREGLYAAQLAEWFQVFDRRQFLVTTTEAIAQDAEEVISDIYKFLGLEKLSGEQLEEVRKNAAGAPRVEWVMRLLNWDSGRKYIGRLPMVGKFVRRVAGRLRELNVRADAAFSGAQVPQRVHRELSVNYQPDILRLEKMLGLDLSAWKKG